MDIQQLAHLMGDGHVEIKEVLPTILKERLQVVHIVIKERTVAIGAHQGVPVQMPPVTMVTDADIGNQSRAILPFLLRMLHGNAQCLQSVGGGNHATVAVGLFDEALTPFYIYSIEPVQFLIPLNRSEIGCR